MIQKTQNDKINKTFEFVNKKTKETDYFNGKIRLKLN